MHCSDKGSGGEREYISRENEVKANSFRRGIVKKRVDTHGFGSHSENAKPPSGCVQGFILEEVKKGQAYEK
jgi:hypothetical protein